MADFIAVIRRAVDGLSDDSPEMRAKVYEKARAAVQRQLDNMKPRPAEDMIARQMAKLSDAIDQVEGGYAEKTAPAAEEISEKPAITPTEPDHPPTEPEPVAQAAPEPAPEPETVDEQESEPAPEMEPEPEPQAVTHENAQADEAEEAHEEVPAEDVGQAATGQDSLHADEETPPAPFVEPPYPDEEPGWHSAVDDDPFGEPEEVLTSLPIEHVTPPALETVEETESLELPPEQHNRVEDERVAPEWLSNSTRDLWPEIDKAGDQAEPSQPSQDDASDDWENFEKIIGYDRVAQNPPAAQQHMPPGNEDLEIAEAIGHLREHNIDSEADTGSSGKRSGRLIAGLLAVVLVLAGTGYAGWHYRDAMLGLFSGSSESGNKGAEDNSAAKTETPQAGNGNASEKAQTAEQEPQKFTQRLLPDGTEVDVGTAGEPSAGGAATQGTSVAGQTETASADQGPASTAPATTDAKQTTAGDVSAKPEKMFLYEERLGQASPTALDGTVKWSVQADKEDGSSQKVIEGDIEVPGRKLSAVMTIKRNTDPSLPASHIIELTFSLPKNFDGGGIENVLRIAMKNNEQDQGDSLIAVPAKITDYFHMIALNAYPDAVKTNLELLKTRDWIDIPITYSNGRRALLTLQKGPSGEAVFNEVLADWQNASSSAPAPDQVPVPTPEPAKP